MKFLLSLTLSVAAHLLTLDFLTRTTGFSSVAQENRPSALPVALKATLITDPRQQKISQAIELIRQSEVKPVPSPQVEKPDIVPPEHSQLPINIYHLRSELTRQPHLVHNVDLSSIALLYPRASGTFILELYINEQGNIDNVVNLSNDLGTSAFEKLKELLMQLSFTGGEIAGKPVKTRYKIEVLLKNAAPEENNEISPP